MEYHIIQGTIAVGEPSVPAIAVEEYLDSEWVLLTYPASQAVVKATTGFLVKFNKPIDLTQLTNANFAIELVTDDSPLMMEEVQDAFQTIDLTTDYNSVSREIALTLTTPLNYLQNYFFIVKDLVSTTGDTQVDENIILFQTNIGGGELVIDGEPEYDTVSIEDYTLIGPPLPLGSRTDLVTCSIPDGTLSVATGTTSFTLQYDALVNTATIAVTKENLETGVVTPLAITATQNSQTCLVTVTIPAVEANCLYTIDAIYASYQFTGVLDPFYVPITHLVPYIESALSDPIYWARIIFMISSEVEGIMGLNAASYLESKPVAVLNYTKYMFASPSTNDSFMLGELQLSEGISDSMDFKSLLKAWEDRLFGYNNAVMSFDPYYPRVVPRTPHRSTHYPQDWEREW
jgi:hypothetical protein